MIETRTGNTLSTQSSEAADFYQKAVDLILGSESGAAEMLDEALKLDKDFALAATARYYVAHDVGDPKSHRYRERAEQTLTDANDWEQAHSNLIIGLINKPSATRANALAYIETTPADLLVISLLTGTMFFYDGPKKIETVLKVYESVEHALNTDWAYLARLGFAASEAGQYHRGRELLQSALAIRPQALYTLHGLAHLLHDTGEAKASATLIQDWLNHYESGARRGQMYGHIQWHLALSEWQTGDHDEAMQRYLTCCAPATTTCGPVLTLADCGGFLLRNYLQSGQPQTLTTDVLSHIDHVWPMIGHPFIALHVAALYASAGDINGLKRCEDGISSTPSGDNRTTSLALVSALTEFAQSNYASASQILATISPEARIGVGGSNVERILIDLLEYSCIAKH